MVFSQAGTVAAAPLMQWAEAGSITPCSISIRIKADFVGFFISLTSIPKNSKGICIFEWGELIEDSIPSDYIKITFSKDFKNNNCRILNIQANSNRLNYLIEEV